MHREEVQGNSQPIVLTQRHPPSMKSLLHLMKKLRSPNTKMLHQETNNTSLQDTKF